MRRNDRAVVEQERILAMVKKCSVCSLAFAGGAFPYVIPLNFGEKAADGKTVLYFHGAGEGIKFVEISKELLLTTDHSIAQIASLTGFSSQSYFAQVFKRESGKTPAQYRKDLSGKSR